MKILTNEEFVKRANKIHNNKFLYITPYKTSKIKVKIKCPIHGIFEQTPVLHLKGQGCSKCKNCNKKTTKEFISEANKIHNGKYEYISEYVNAHTKIKIKCPIHGVFEQTPNAHVTKKQQCRKCSGKNILNKKDFIKKSNVIHNNSYDYSSITYIDTKHPVSIICAIHGIFNQIPSYHLSGGKCPKCSKKYKYSTNEFIQKANIVHNEYEYPDKYVNSKTKIRIICPEHGEFYQRPSDHINKKNGCPKCLVLHKFAEKSNIIHGKYEYPDKYVNSKTKIRIICPEHGEFYQRPSDHINKKTRCPECAKSTYSQKAISWLNEIAKKENINIQHAENDGEYRIPGTKYKADGYCKENNTIYEFYGDIWHGNLDLFDADEIIRPFLKECAGALYMKTMQREREIKKLGYNLITIWENNYK